MSRGGEVLPVEPNSSCSRCRAVARCATVNARFRLCEPCLRKLLQIANDVGERCGHCGRRSELQKQYQRYEGNLVGKWFKFFDTKRVKTVRWVVSDVDPADVEFSVGAESESGETDRFGEAHVRRLIAKFDESCVCGPTLRAIGEHVEDCPASMPERTV